MTSPISGRDSRPFTNQGLWTSELEKALKELALGSRSRTWNAAEGREETDAVPDCTAASFHVDTFISCAVNNLLSPLSPSPSP